jgi:hypothetical protein
MAPFVFARESRDLDFMQLIHFLRLIYRIHVNFTHG